MSELGPIHTKWKRERKQNKIKEQAKKIIEQKANIKENFRFRIQFFTFVQSEHSFNLSNSLTTTKKPRAIWQNILSFWVS